MWSFKKTLLFETHYYFKSIHRKPKQCIWTTKSNFISIDNNNFPKDALTDYIARSAASLLLCLVKTSTDQGLQTNDTPLLLWRGNQCGVEKWWFYKELLHMDDHQVNISSDRLGPSRNETFDRRTFWSHLQFQISSLENNPSLMCPCLQAEIRRRKKNLLGMNPSHRKYHWGG